MKEERGWGSGECWSDEVGGRRETEDVEAPDGRVDRCAFSSVTLMDAELCVDSER